VAKAVMISNSKMPPPTFQAVKIKAIMFLREKKLLP
jgi:hypothetical protein